MRRYVWGVLLAMIACAVVAKGVFVTHTRVRFVEPQVVCIDDCPLALAVPQIPPVPPIPPANVKRTVRIESRGGATQKKPGKPAVADTSIVRNKSFTSAPAVSEEEARGEVLDAALGWATHELNLAHAADREFFGRPDIAELKFKKGESVDGTDTHIAILHVGLTRVAERELLDLDRRVVAAERMDAAGRGVAWLTVLFGAVAGFVRLDEWTKGYYTKRLGALLGGLVLAATALIVSV